MVKRWFTLIGREIRGLHEAAYLLALFALISLILALVRDKLLAFSFGAGHTLDIYYAAFRIPDFIFASIGSLVSASILLPYFIDRFGRSREEGMGFSDSIFTVFFALIVAASAVAFVLAPYLIPVLIPGFARDPSLPALIFSMRIMLLSPFFLGLSNLFSSLTQMRHRFLVYAASPVVYNAGIIAGVLLFYPFMGVSGLALGVALGAFLHMGIQIPFMAAEKLLPRFTMKIDWPNIRRIILTSFPRTLTLSANQLASFVLVSMASLMASGSISIFNFAFNLQSVPLSLIGASYSSAVFPTLSRLYYDKNIKEFLEKMIASARHIIFWSMPLTVLFIVLRAQIVRTVLGAGKFDWTDTRLTAAMLALFIVSTVGQSLIVLFVRGFYAEGKTAKPLMINAISAVSIVVLAFIFWKVYFTMPFFHYFLEDLLKTSGQTGGSVLILALAYTLGVILNTILHWVTFERSYPGFTKPVFSTIFHSFAASVIMGYASYLSLRIFAAVFPLTKVWGVFMQGFLSGVIGLVVFVITLIILQNRELSEVWAAFHRKIWKAAVPPAEVEHL
ncbi:MAG: lipid II flippase MurJ [Minisyncoccia bacterium]|jgi:putative peptidoglycan lipid II flippase